MEKYKGKIKIDGYVIADPMVVKTGWFGEKNGVSKWSLIFNNDITNYLNISEPLRSGV